VRNTAQAAGPGPRAPSRFFHPAGFWVLGYFEFGSNLTYTVPVASIWPVSSWYCASSARRTR